MTEACQRLQIHIAACGVFAALVYMIIRFSYYVMPMDTVNVVMFNFVFISDAANEFIHGDNKDLLN